MPDAAYREMPRPAIDAWPWRERRTAVAEREAADTVAGSSVTDGQWWEVNGPLLERVLDPSAFPLAVRVGAAVGEAYGSAWDADRAWICGLERTVDGLAATVSPPSG